MRVLALYNIKGGVGKTTAAVNLAYLSAAAGARTLIWDIDPQGAATYTFRIKPRVKGGAEKLLRKGHGIGRAIKGTDFENLDLIPGDFSYRHLDILLEGKHKPARRLRKLIRPLSAEYDFLYFDCPPSISLVSEAVFQAVDCLVVPVIPTPFSMRTLEQLRRFQKRHGLEEMKVLPFFSMVDRRKKLHRAITEDPPGKGPRFLSATIPFASIVEQMGIRREPLECFSPRSTAASAFLALWREIMEEAV